jgi:integrase/recombinase XerD
VFEPLVRRFSVGVVLVVGSCSRLSAESEDIGVRAFQVRLPSGQRYWTVLNEDLNVVRVADDFLRHQRLGRDGAESTTKAYAHAIALFLRWCARTGRSWQAGVEHVSLFMTWLAHAGPDASNAGAAGGGGVVLAGPGAAPARSASRINGVLTAVRGMVVHAVSVGHGSAGLVALLYEVADDRDLPQQARGADGRMAWRMRARHRLREPETVVDRASDEQIVALLRRRESLYSLLAGEYSDVNRNGSRGPFCQCPMALSLTEPPPEPARPARGGCH